MPDASKTLSCPYCKEEIREKAIRCKQCRSDLGPEHVGGIAIY